VRKKIAEKLIKKFHTNCPFQIAREMGVVILFERLKDTLGYFNTYKRIKIIHINQELSEVDQRFACAHELAHSVLHPAVNTPFLKKNTLFSISRIEREANEFAVELLLPDTLLYENQDIALCQVAATCGVPGELIYLKKQIKKDTAHKYG
jgi:Zn-dependent peptidase ImmA (M78 family)